MQDSGNIHPDAPRHFHQAAISDIGAVVMDGAALFRKAAPRWVALYLGVTIASLGAAFLISVGMVLTGRSLQFLLPGILVVVGFRLTAAADGYAPVETPSDVPWPDLWIILGAGAVNLVLYLLYMAADPRAGETSISVLGYIATVLPLQISISLVVLAAVSISWPGIGLLMLPLALMLRRHPADIVPSEILTPPTAARLVPALGLLWLGMTVTMFGLISLVFLPFLICQIHAAARRAFWGNKGQ